MESEIEWPKPSPGTWEFDVSHQSKPFGRFLDDVMLEPTKRGFAEGFARVGIPLATVEPAIVNGWWYTCVRPLGGPPEGGHSPPKVVFSLLFSVVPELRRRRSSAARFFDDQPWVELNASWFDVERPTYAARLDDALNIVPHQLGDAKLSETMRELHALASELTYIHFVAVPTFSVLLGDFMVQSEAWGAIAAKDAMRAVAGYTHVTSRPIQALDAVVAALRDANALNILTAASSDDPRHVLDEIAAASPRCARTLRDYQREFGTRVATDCSPLGLTLNEMPELLVGNLAQRADAPSGSASARQQADAAAAELRLRFDEKRREQWDELLERARAATNRREDDGGLFLQAVGLLRTLLLEVGARLVQRGRADEAESAFDLTCDELEQLLAGGGPALVEVREYTALRRRNSMLVPPSTIGPHSSPPDVAVFPQSMQRVVSAIFAFIRRFSPDGDPITEQGLAGHGVSPGVVTGRARVIRSHEDFTRFARSDVLVANATSPSFNVLLAAASAVVTQTGGLICHAAIVAREFGIPGIVGVRGVLDAVPDGALVRVDGDRGVIEILQSQADARDLQQQDARRNVVLERPLRKPQAHDRPGLIVPLRDASRAALFGGKGAGLAVLCRAGLRVPWGIALDVTATESIAAGDPSHLCLLKEALDGCTGPFAVRSSATTEDSATASFAGQFETVLGVTSFEDIVKAVESVWLSGNSAAVQAYQARLNRNADVKMAVVIQELVDAQSAGVLFFDPNQPRHVIEATWGYGELVVDGSVSPDRYEIDDHGGLSELTIGEKTQELVRNGKGLKRRPTSDARARTRCLSDADLGNLARLGQQAVRAFGDARDIEWAVTPKGVYCLQARPITRNLHART